MCLFFKIWAAKKYNLHAIVHNLNLVHYSQNLDNELGFFSLALLNTDTRKVDPLIVLIFNKVFNVIRRLKA